LISGSVYELLRNPARRDWLEEDWSRAGLAVEEFLRFISVVQLTKPRFIRKDVELGGVRLKKGEKIMPMLAAANFDPEANSHPEKLDLARKPNRHLAFGTGIHFCLGHQLARLEGACALRPCFGAGRNSGWQGMKPRSNGANGRASKLSSICRSRSFAKPRLGAHHFRRNEETPVIGRFFQLG
jgi:cytochrome P450 PksS